MNASGCNPPHNCHNRDIAARQPVVFPAPLSTVKLTLVTETFPPEVNGVAMTLHRLVTGLIARGHDVQVVRPRQKADKVERQHDFPEDLVTGFPLPGYQGLQFGSLCTGHLKKLWSADRPDVVHIATEGPLGVAALNAARKLGIPVISSYHTNFHSYGDHYGYAWLSGLMLGFFRWFHNRTRATFVPSEDIQRTLEQAQFRNVKIFSRGVDTQLFGTHCRSEELRREWGAEPNTPVVVYVGRVASEKNIPLTVKAFLRFRDKHPAAKLVIVGDGPERKKLEKEHPEIHFAGMRRGENLAAHYASADFFFFASVTETFGNVITEAMASGLVVLSYDYAAALRHIQEGVNGYKAPYNDESAYLAAIDRLAADSANWPSVREQAVQTAQGLSWDHILQKYEDDAATAMQDTKAP